MYRIRIFFLIYGFLLIWADDSSRFVTRDDLEIDVSNSTGSGLASQRFFKIESFGRRSPKHQKYGEFL